MPEIETLVCGNQPTEIRLARSRHAVRGCLWRSRQYSEARVSVSPAIVRSDVDGVPLAFGGLSGLSAMETEEERAMTTPTADGASDHVIVRAVPADTTASELDAVLEAASCSADGWGLQRRDERAVALRAVADGLNAASEELVALAVVESHLPANRLTGEVHRTMAQLRLFAEVLEDGSYLEVMIDHPDPVWPSGPRPDLRRMLVPLGPALVFAASNFPFAFSVAGGDTASALAAGCPVVLKAHPGHPRLSAATGEVVNRALASVDAPVGTFAVVFGEEAGRAAICDGRIRAGAFTGSLRGGRALFDLATSRPDPIPFYGELGSLNPIFVTTGAAEARMSEITTGYVASFTLGAGQFCTKPGFLFVPEAAYDETAFAEVVAAQPAAPLLNSRIEQGYHAVLEGLRSHAALRTVVNGRGGESPEPTLLATTVSDLLAAPDALLIECFGPTSVVVTCTDDDEMLAAAAAFGGQLTATVHGLEGEATASALLGVLAGRAGRVVWNGWPTGVSVTWAMEHGGPWPATTAPTSTSVGTAAISRFLRPVTYQATPDALLPAALREANPLRLPRRVDGRVERGD